LFLASFTIVAPPVSLRLIIPAVCQVVTDELIRNAVMTKVGTIGGSALMILGKTKPSFRTRKPSMLGTVVYVGKNRETEPTNVTTGGWRRVRKFLLTGRVKLNVRPNEPKSDVEVKG